MNANTKESLKLFVESVERMAQGCIHMIGMDGAKDVINSAEQLKASIEKDETLP